MITLNELIEDLNEKDIAEFLSQAGSDPNATYTGNFVAYKGETILSLACRFGKIAEVRQLLERAEDAPGFNPQPIKVNKRTLEGDTPLMCAVMNNRIEIAELLLKHQAEINLEKKGYTALRMAEENGDVKMVALLRAYHAIIKVPVDPILPRRFSIPGNEQKNPTVFINLECSLGSIQDISAPKKAIRQ